MNKVISILFVEDHHVIRHAIKMMLNTQSHLQFQIYEALNGQDALKQASKKKFDIVLLDLNLPDIEGVAMIRSMLHENRDQKILVFTSHTDPTTIRQVLSVGAMGYIIKICSPEELVRAISLVSKGEKYYCNEAAQAIIGSGKTDVKTPKGMTEVLTKREIEVLKMVAKELTNLEIANTTKLSIRTIEGHRRKIRTKLQIRNTAGLIKYAIENNYI